MKSIKMPKTMHSIDCERPLVDCMKNEEGRVSACSTSAGTCGQVTQIFTALHTSANDWKFYAYWFGGYK